MHTALGHLKSKPGTHHGKLTSYSNFVNVAEGRQRTKPQGSSCNNQEISVIEAMIKTLVEKGCDVGQICVVTAYLWQLENLQKMKDKNGWAEWSILSADTCQGGEWKIKILSLVKTDPEGSPSFTGELPRANVVTTRAREARYFVGNWDFWKRAPLPDGKFEVMHAVLQQILRDEGNGFVTEMW